MRTFKEFLEQGAVKKKKKDEARARNLLEGAEKRKKVMEKYLPLNEETAVKIVEECYDVIRELLEAKLSNEGYKSYSHEAVISYLENLGFTKEEFVFSDKLREIRNGIKYYGKDVGLEYAKKVKDFLEQVFERLKKAVFD
jgi:hypothetical protein